VEDPRRQPRQVVDSSSTIRGTVGSASKAVANSLKLESESVTRGCCPAGTDDGPHMYALASNTTTAAATTKMAPLFTVSMPRRIDRQ